jgi:hypothetical protein
MALLKYQCKKCKAEKETLKKEIPEHCGEPMKKVISAPGTKLMETVNPATGRKRLKDQQKILLERARNHSRDVEGHELVQMNKANDVVKINQLNAQGKKRTKLDDI